MIAPLVAADNPDVAFIILLAGPGTPCDQLLIAQGQLIVKAMGGDAKALSRQLAVQKKLIDLAKKGADEKALKAAMKDIENDLTPEEKKALDKVRAAAEAQASAEIARLATPWFHYFLNYDPRPVLAKVKCPVLAINGEKDLQVPPKENLEAIDKAFKGGGNKDVTIKEFPGLNHLFQPCKSGLPSEYGKIETTFAPKRSS